MNWIMPLNLTIENQMALLWTNIVQILSSDYMWLKTIASWLVNILPAIVAIIAIYYAYLKEGKISVGLLTYCICDKQNVNDWDIELPLGFYNTGATGKTILGLRIKFKKDDWISKPLYCNHTTNDLGIGANGKSEDVKRKWAKPFIIEPRRGYTDCFCFSIKRKIENIKLSKGKYRILLEAKFANKKRWKEIGKIDFYVDNDDFNCITVYPNDPEFFKPGKGNEENGLLR